MHIAFNKVHPKTLKMFTPYKDFEILEQTARKMEKKYGLSIDNGMSDRNFNQPSLSGSARDYEAQTWQQSFQSYLIEHKKEILDAVGKAKNWQGVHKALSEFDTGIKKRGNGLAFHHLKGNQAMKASALDRSFSLKAMEEKFGAFEPPKEQTNSEEKKTSKTYVPKPLLSKHPHTSQLWKRYLMSKKVIPRSTLLGRTAANWKMFLMTEAHADPLAMVLLIAHQELIHAIFGPSGKAIAPIPKLAAAQLVDLMSLSSDGNESIELLRKQAKAMEMKAAEFEKRGLQGKWASQKAAGLRYSISEIEEEKNDATKIKPVRSKNGHLIDAVVLGKNGNRAAIIGESGNEKKMPRDDL